MGDFERAVRRGALMLTDGGIETRVMFETGIQLPPHVQVAALVDDPAGGPVLRRIFEGYVDAARSCGLPVIIGTPTFRASLNFARRAGLGGAEAVRRLNRDAAAMHRGIRADSKYRPVFVAGVIGPSGDAYRPEESLSAAEAREYHGLQADELARAGVDFLYAPTFPEVEEALGAGQAMGDTGLPYVVSFVLERDGRVLDGTPLHSAIERIDAAASPAPLFYSISCVHPSIAAGALREEAVFSDLVSRRLNEFKANASPLSTQELVRLDHPEGDDPESFADGMWEIHEEFGLRVLGGCCGTDDRHMRALALRMASAR
ncbi:homocysteine S-methyltransferase family protein [Rubrobacter tropicus]|uniref:Homocysteine S-methyltransferase family protein n=1 Tax=Rubrobacter tropicus TaxID=2653851 RepID=A0A6G8Q9Y5_9ACTN|nr:homocysteine S-methyltransferase family protein [Rubrobacter tropicus]QIN83238.1 homocysteine S-methyltransferase family protein [Rubrobacter tropicus]